MADYLFDPIFNGLNQVLDLRQKQHSLSATNLANVDTPGFHAKYVNFDTILDAAMDKGGLLQLQRSDSQHLNTANNPDMPNVVEIDPMPWSANDNSVYAEREVGRMTHNSLMYRSVAQGMSKRFALLKYASSDGGR
jgi:flagellar basal-body rod protein FlgB